MQAAVEEHQLVRTLRWYDGFVIALANPGFLIGFLGYSIGALGGWAAVALWAISMLIGTLSNWIYAELAAMFPDKPGGIALYAHEGWRGYFSLVGPIATFGYWFAWSTSLSIFGLVVGALIQRQWFSGADWTFSTGLADDLGLGHIIGGGLVIVVCLANAFGLRPAMWLSYLTGAMLMISLAVFIVVPYLTGDWDSSQLTWDLDDEGQPWGGLKLALVWLYLMGWSAYGVETCATFAPEYKDTVRDTSRALRTSALFSLGVYALLPLGITGTIGQEAAADDPVAFYVPAFEKIVGGGSDLMVVFLAGSLILSMTVAMADGSRALYGIARDRMTIRQLHHLNRHHVPARAMAVDMVINLCLLFFVGNTLAILVAGNLGYMLAHFFALSAFVLLRRDRPQWPRPIRLHRRWVYAAAFLAAVNGLLIGVGATSPSLTGYGGLKEALIGLGVLASSVVLYCLRRVVQDKEPIRLRDKTAALPPPEPEISRPLASR